MVFHKYARCCFILIGMMFSQIMLAQNHDEIAMQLIQENKIEEAKAYINKKLDSLVTKKAYKNTSSYIYPLGKVSMLKDSLTQFTDVIKYHNIIIKEAPTVVKFHSYIALALLYNDQGKASKAYKKVSLAKSIAQDLNVPELLLESSFYQAEYGMKQGNYQQLFKHTDEAITVMKSFPNKKYHLAPRVYNYKASICHFTSKPDSANYYFKKALSGIKNMKPTPENKYYLPGTINGNWFLVKQSEGNYDEAMQLSLESIRLFQEFLSNTNNHPLTSRVHGNMSISFRNVGSLYYDLGDKEKALKFARIGYNHAKKNFLPNTIHYYNALLMMGEANLYGNNLEAGFKYLNEAKSVLQNLEGDNYNWHAQLYRVLGDAYLKKGNYESAVSYYEKSKYIYSNYNADALSQNQIYLNLGLAKSYSKTKTFDKAKNTAKAIYEITKKKYGEKAYLTKAALLTLGEISFEEKDYKSSINYANQGIKIIEDLNITSERSLAFFGMDYVDFLLLKQKAIYIETDKKDLIKLKKIGEDVNQIIRVLENRKIFKSSIDENYNDFILNKELFEFAKKVQYDLFKISNDNNYLNALIELHESSIYHRIRTRLNLKHIKPKNVPEEVVIKENKIKTKLNKLMADESFEKEGLDSLNIMIKIWDDFLEDLKHEHSSYYKMRYESLKNSSDTFLKTINSKKTLVRYFNIDEELYVLVFNSNDISLFNIKTDEIGDLIQTTLNNKTLEKDYLLALNKLYKLLWKPIENIVKTENIVIYPQGDLFNLSFELLTPKKLNNFSELADNSLLAKYNISYNYSLFLLNEENKTIDFKEDVLAFAPEFNANMKAHYKVVVKDSIELDKAYLTLLPQPFSISLVKKINEKFKGKSFVNDNASKQMFTKIPKEHKIIHISTHAESNNLNPELSRLIFAKNISDSTDLNNNYLYAFEIYNQSLNSKLAILTACETGKPTFQPGEGMISLAHAFNYAGSESILTSLWQIDEKSSSEILDYFYSFLKKGVTKDKALREAKLKYLNNAKGRALHPNYWSGLILMGNTTPIELDLNMHYLWWVMGFFILLGILILIRKNINFFI